MKATISLRPLAEKLRNPRIEVFAYLAAVALLLVSLWLPPFSAGARLFHLDYPSIAKAGGAVSAMDGAQLLIPEGALTSGLRLKIAAMSPEDFLAGNGDRVANSAAQAVSTGSMKLLGNLYRFLTHGPLPTQATLTVPVVREVANLVDVYAWDGTRWNWQPARALAEDGLLEAQLDTIPAMAMVVQAEAEAPMLSVLAAYAELPIEKSDVFSQIHLAGFSAMADGSISAPPRSVDGPAPAVVVPVVSNGSDAASQLTFLEGLLSDPQVRASHVKALTTLAVEGMYPGLQLDYRGLSAGSSEGFAAFVSELADSLHKEGKTLAVRVPTPTQVADDRWDTGAYDWQSLGESVDYLVVSALENPTAYASAGQMDALLNWSVGHVNRSKLQLALSVRSYEVEGQEISRIPYREALSQLGNLAVEGGKYMVSPGEEVAVSLASLLPSGGFQYSIDHASYWVSLPDAQGSQKQIWFENATSLGHKLRLILEYNIGGVVIEHLSDAGNDPRMWDILRESNSLTIPSMESDFTVLWTVAGPEGEQAQAIGSLVGGRGAGGPDAGGPGEVALAAASSGLEVRGPQSVWRVPDQPGEYTIAASISTDGGQTIQVQSNSVSLEVPTPTPTPTPTATPTRVPTPTPKPQPKPQVAAVSSRGPGFAYGIQGDAITDGDHGRLFGLVQQLGFGWFKQQVEWFRYNPGPGQYDWGALDRIVDSASAAGIKVLFSVVKAPKWARPPGDTEEGPPADPNTYGTFLREMAARYKGRVQAYEIWNEQNLYYEWGGLNRPNAAEYIALLKVAYASIKAVDSGATVVSGALTPTGAPLPWAVDDFAYLEQMYQLGLKNYCDAVGVHPSGFNVPPDVKWQDACAYITQTNSGYRGPCDSPHHSWSFRSTMEGYRNIMVTYGDGAKRLWVTEFGWASVEGLGVAPAQGYGYAADNTEAEQAQNITRAYQIAKSWGWVGPMFLWQLNFGPICGCQDEKSAFGIVRPDWSMRPAFAALANMPK